MLRALGQLFTHGFTGEHPNELVPQKTVDLMRNVTPSRTRVLYSGYNSTLINTSRPSSVNRNCQHSQSSHQTSVQVNHE